MKNTEVLPFFDLFIIGGGINGAGIAADAAGRDLSVYLCEKDDLANHTSSASTKMIHGGLRYLEYYEFRLVREALAEREVLLRNVPHLIEPLKLIIPHSKQLRPTWLIRLGLLIYDYLGFKWGQKSLLPHSKLLKFSSKPSVDNPLKNIYRHGFSYWDCKVDDARLVIANALAAKQAGASINPRTEFINAIQKNGLWEIQLQNAQGQFTIQAKAIVNAAGAWVSKINEKLAIKTQHHLKLVKGSHIVFPRFYQGDHAYLLQNSDKRVVFVIPYHQNFTMVGTTDIAYLGDPNKVEIDFSEKEYLCTLINQYFNQQFTPNDIVNEWSGVRALQADNAEKLAANTRDYSLEIFNPPEQAPILSIFGGKITTYRRLAENVLKILNPFFPTMGKPWTNNAALPGGNFPYHNREEFIQSCQQRYANLPSHLIKRWTLAYGTRITLLVSEFDTIESLGQQFCTDLYQKEVDYLIEHEWAKSAEDILWRRSKLGLKVNANEIDLLNEYLRKKSHHSKERVDLSTCIDYNSGSKFRRVRGIKALCLL